MLPLAASQSAQLHLTFAVMVAGFVIGVFGHITRLRWLIVLGILVIGADSVYFVVGLHPGAGGTPLGL